MRKAFVYPCTEREGTHEYVCVEKRSGLRHGGGGACLCVDVKIFNGSPEWGQIVWLYKSVLCFPRVGRKRPRVSVRVVIVRGSLCRAGGDAYDCVDVESVRSSPDVGDVKSCACVCIWKAFVAPLTGGKGDEYTCVLWKSASGSPDGGKRAGMHVWKWEAFEAPPTDGVGDEDVCLGVWKSVHPPPAAGKGRMCVHVASVLTPSR